MTAARQALQGCRRILEAGMTPAQRDKARARLDAVARERVEVNNYPHGHPYRGGWPKDRRLPRLLRRQA